MVEEVCSDADGTAGDGGDGGFICTSLAVIPGRKMNVNVGKGGTRAKGLPPNYLLSTAGKNSSNWSLHFNRS